MKPIVDELDKELMQGIVEDEERAYRVKLDLAMELRDEGYTDDQIEKALGFDLREADRQQLPQAVNG